MYSPFPLGSASSENSTCRPRKADGHRGWARGCPPPPPNPAESPDAHTVGQKGLPCNKGSHRCGGWCLAVGHTHTQHLAGLALAPGDAHLCTQLLLDEALSIIAPGPDVGHVVFRMPKPNLHVHGRTEVSWGTSAKLSTLSPCLAFALLAQGHRQLPCMCTHSAPVTALGHMEPTEQEEEDETSGSMSPAAGSKPAGIHRAPPEQESREDRLRPS